MLDKKENHFDTIHLSVCRHSEPRAEGVNTKGRTAILLESTRGRNRRWHLCDVQVGVSAYERGRWPQSTPQRLAINLLSVFRSPVRLSMAVIDMLAPPVKMSGF